VSQRTFLRFWLCDGAQKTLKIAVKRAAIGCAGNARDGHAHIFVGQNFVGHGGL
jgi:hypothetical protein